MKPTHDGCEGVPILQLQIEELSTKAQKQDAHADKFETTAFQKIDALEVRIGTLETRAAVNEYRTGVNFVVGAVIVLVIVYIVFPRLVAIISKYGDTPPH